jgi:hypothetical protein
VRWFSVQIWRAWRVEGHDFGALEEAVILVRATSKEDAAFKVRMREKATDSSFRNELGQTVEVVGLEIDTIFDTNNSGVSSGEVFGRLYEISENGEVDWGPRTSVIQVGPSKVRLANKED